MSTDETMATVPLQSHLLRELTRIVCSRSQFERRYKPTSCIGRLIAAGERSLKALREVIEDDVWITRVGDSEMRFEFCGIYWEVDELFLNNLFIKWARRLHAFTFHWLYDLPRQGFVKAMVENEDLEELSIGRWSKNDWPMILEIFPKLISMTMSSVQFADMLENSPKEHFHLKEIRLKDDEGTLGVALQALLTHRTKCPNLEAIFYFDDSMKPVEIPESEITIPTIKHLGIDITTECCAKLDFSILDAANKLFPSLESVYITVNSHCHDHDVRKVDSIDELYEAFHLLRFGFFVELYYREKLNPSVENLEELHQHLAAKGKLYGYQTCFTVETLYPEKALIHKVVVSGYEDDYDEVTYFCGDSSSDDLLSDDGSFGFSD
uniref:F-box domain-containing protein n=1 Tax=Panagrellus redivivus TaxID=6233 RepID=A0A7E4UTR1_PANRE